VAQVARGKGWNTEQFWGWSPQQAVEAAARYAASNQEFAHRTSMGQWTLDSPVARATNTAQLVELSGGVINRVHQFVDGMAGAFVRLRSGEDDA
jgi:hypothetical protein